MVRFLSTFINTGGCGGPSKANVLQFISLQIRLKEGIRHFLLSERRRKLTALGKNGRLGIQEILGEWRGARREGEGKRREAKGMVEARKRLRGGVAIGEESGEKRGASLDETIARESIGLPLEPIENKYVGRATERMEHLYQERGPEAGYGMPEDAEGVPEEVSLKDGKGTEYKTGYLGIGTEEALDDIKIEYFSIKEAVNRLYSTEVEE